MAYCYCHSQFHTNTGLSQHGILLLSQPISHKHWLVTAWHIVIVTANFTQTLACHSMAYCYCHSQFHTNTGLSQHGILLLSQPISHKHWLVTAWHIVIVTANFTQTLACHSMAYCYCHSQFHTNTGLSQHGILLLSQPISHQHWLVTAWHIVIVTANFTPTLACHSMAYCYCHSQFHTNTGLSQHGILLLSQPISHKHWLVTAWHIVIVTANFTPTLACHSMAYCYCHSQFHTNTSLSQHGILLLSQPISHQH